MFGATSHLAYIVRKYHARNISAMICNMQFVIMSSALLSLAVALPQYPTHPHQYTTPIPIISQKHEQNIDGSYAYSYQTGNGINAEERGAIKNYGSPDNEINSVQGYFSYPGTDGVQYSVAYTADENGFVAHGAHLPTPPPIPYEIQKALDSLPRDDTQYDDRGFPIRPGQQYPSNQQYAPAPPLSSPSSFGAPVQGFGGRS